MNADTVWLEQDPSMAHAVRLHRGNTHTTLYRWSQVNAVIKAHGVNIKGAELINKYAPPKHNDGDVWLAQDPTMAHALRVYRQLPGGDETHQCLYSWADVNDVLRSNKVVEGAELISKYPAPRHRDGDVWLEQDPSMPHALRVVSQRSGREYHSCLYSWADVNDVLKKHDVVAGAELISKYPAPRHKDGDVWLEQDPSMPHALRLYWQQGGREIHQCQYNLRDAERAIAGRHLVAGEELLDRWRVIKPAVIRRGIDD